MPTSKPRSDDIAKAVHAAKIAATLKKAQIGRCGELLVQYKLLKEGVESAPMTTDAGIDLVAYSPKSREPVTIQVKACHRPKRAGGKGRMTLDWWVPKKVQPSWWRSLI
jgi:hypothetical protein